MLGCDGLAIEDNLPSAPQGENGTVAPTALNPCDQCLVYSRGPTLQEAEDWIAPNDVALHVVQYGDPSHINDVPMSPAGHVVTRVVTSPDRTRIAYVHYESAESGEVAIAELSGDFASHYVIAVSPDEEVRSLDWLSPDLLLFATIDQTQSSRVWLVTLTGTNPSEPQIKLHGVTPPGEVGYPNPLPESHGVVFETPGDDPTTCTWYLMHLDPAPTFLPLIDLDCASAGEVIPSAHGDFFAISYSQGDSPELEGVAVFDAATGSRVPVNLTPGEYFTLAWAPSGSTFVYGSYHSVYEGDAGYDDGGVVAVDARTGNALSGAAGYLVGFLDDDWFITEALYDYSPSHPYEKVPLAGGPPISLGEPRFFVRGAQAEHGLLAFQTYTSIQLMNTSEPLGELQVVSHELAPDEEMASFFIANDGKRLAYATSIPEDRSALYFVEVANLTRAWRATLPESLDPTILEWSEQPQGAIVRGRTYPDPTSRLYFVDFVSRESTGLGSDVTAVWYP